MPAFFFFSGLFASSKGTWKEALKIDVKRLLLPVLLWHIIGVFTWEPLQTYYMDKDTFLQSFLDAQLQFFSGMSCGFGWFMIALFWMRIEYRALSRCNRRVQYVFAFAIMPIVAYVLHSYIMLPFYVLQSFMAFPFFFLAHELKETVMREYNNKMLQFTPPILFVTTLFLMYYNDRGSIPSMEYANNVVVFYVQGIIGALFIVSIAKQFKVFGRYQSLASTLGGGTMVLLLFQPPFLLAAKWVYRLLMHPSHSAPYFPVFGAAVSSVVIMLLMYPLIKLINKHLPILNGR